MGWSFKVGGQARFLNIDTFSSFSALRDKRSVLIITVMIFAITGLIGLICLAIFIIKNIKIRNVIEDWELDIGPQRYSYRELKKVTRGFKDSELLRSCGFGKVYKGTLPNLKTLVAVMRISSESKQGLREFISEISTNERLHHRNLAQLQGWCHCQGDLLLIYEFMPNGSFSRCLFNEPKSILSWEQRFNIIKGISCGFQYNQYSGNYHCAT